MNANLDLVRTAISRLLPNAQGTMLMASPDQAREVLTTLLEEAARRAAAVDAAAAVDPNAGLVAKLEAVLQGLSTPAPRIDVDALTATLEAQEPHFEQTRGQRRWDLAAQLMYLLVERTIDRHIGSSIPSLSYGDAMPLAETAYNAARALTTVDDARRAQDADESLAELTRDQRRDTTPVVDRLHRGACAANPFGRHHEPGAPCDCTPIEVVRPRAVEGDLYLHE